MHAEKSSRIRVIFMDFPLRNEIERRDGILALILGV